MVTKIGKINYEINICNTGKRKMRRIVHVNHLKKWEDNHANILKVVVIAEDGVRMRRYTDSETEAEREFSSEQWKQLQGVIEKYRSLFSDSVGETHLTLLMYRMLCVHCTDCVMNRKNKLGRKLSTYCKQALSGSPPASGLCLWSPIKMPMIRLGFVWTSES